MPEVDWDVARLPHTWALGFDLGSYEAACVLVDEQDMLVWTRCWKGGRRQQLEPRLREFLLWASEGVLMAHNFAEGSAKKLVVAAEMPYIFSNFARAGLVLSWQLGLVHSLAIRRELPFLPISPQEGKAALTGKGNASKADMMAMAKAITERDLAEHEADAFGIALAGSGQVRQEALSNLAADTHRDKGE